MDTYEHPKICSECGGKCCKQYPGSMSPDDVIRLGQSDDMRAALAEVLVTGDYAIDWWEGDPREGHNELDRGYYLRPRVKGDARIFSPSWGGPCTFLVPGVGCRLSAQDRPMGYRELEPIAGDPSACIAHAGAKLAAAQRWLPYYDCVEKQDECFEEVAER